MVLFCCVWVCLCVVFCDVSCCVVLDICFAVFVTGDVDVWNGLLLCWTARFFHAVFCCVGCVVMCVCVCVAWMGCVMCVVTIFFSSLFCWCWHAMAGPVPSGLGAGILAVIVCGRGGGGQYGAVPGEHGGGRLRLAVCPMSQVSGALWDASGGGVVPSVWRCAHLRGGPPSTLPPLQPFHSSSWDMLRSALDPRRSSDNELHDRPTLPFSDIRIGVEIEREGGRESVCERA